MIISTSICVKHNSFRRSFHYKTFLLIGFAIQPPPLPLNSSKWYELHQWSFS